MFLFVMILLFSSCPGREEAPEPGKVRVIATLFVLYDFAREIGGEETAVTLLIPPGAEAHSYEPTPRDIIAIKNVNVFLYGGLAMDPWAENLLPGLAGEKVVAADASRGIALLYTDRADETEHTTDTRGEDDHTGLHADPHFWLDPVRAMTMADTIRDALIAADPVHAEEYAKRARIFKGKLAVLDEEIRSALARRKESTVVFGGHNMWGYFAARYSITFISPFAGFSPEAEPQARRLVELSEIMKRYKLSVIYHEEGIDPKTARVLSEATGARLVMLHGAHNVSKEALQAGVSYLLLMRDNLRKLKEDPGLF